MGYLVMDLLSVLVSSCGGRQWGYTWAGVGRARVGVGVWLVGGFEDLVDVFVCCWGQGRCGMW